MSMQPDADILDMMKRLEHEVDTQYVAIVDDILDLLEKRKMAYRMRIPSRRVGMDKDNRGGCGFRR